MGDGVNPAIFVDEGAAEQWLIEARWPDGVFCPRCYCDDIRRTEGSAMPFRCRCCYRSFSVTSGTPLHSCNLSYTKLVLGFYLLTAAETGMHLEQIDRLLGTSRQAAWALVSKMKEAWSEGE